MGDRDAITDNEFLEQIEGLYAGQLDRDERKRLHELEIEGKAKIVYSGAGGFLGLGRIVRQ